MMRTGGGELFSEDGWPVRAEIKKTGLRSQRSDPNRIRLGQKARERERTMNKTRKRERKMLICFK
jgi:hypothetical protein